MSKLQENLEEILKQKRELLIPTNIRAGVTVLGVEGNMEGDKPDQEKTVDPSIVEQTVVADTGYELAKVTINPVTNEIDSNIAAENIKSGVTILGVEGTLEAGSGGVKLYETVAEMQADTDVVDGDLAEVYVDKQVGYIDDNRTHPRNNLYIPEEITLPTAITKNTYLATIELGYNYGDCHIYIQNYGDGSMTWTLAANSYGGGGSIYKSCTATSTDKIHYTFSESANADRLAFMEACKSPDIYDEDYFSDDIEEANKPYVNVCLQVNVFDFKIYERKDGEWVNRDIHTTLVESNKLLKGYTAFSNNQVIKGSYNPITAKDVFYKFYGIDGYTEMNSLINWAPFKTLTQDQFKSDTLKMLVKNNTNPMVYGTFGGNSSELKYMDLGVELSGITGYAVKYVKDNVTEELYGVYYETASKILVYNIYSDTYTRYDLGSSKLVTNDAEPYSRVCISDNILYAAVDTTKIAMVNLITEEVKVLNTDATKEVIVEYVYDNKIIYFVHGRTSYGNASLYVGTVEGNNVVSTLIDDTCYHNYYYFPAGRYVAYFTQDSKENADIIKIYNVETGTIVSGVKTPTGIHKPGVPAVARDGYIYLMRGKLEISSATYTPYYTGPAGLYSGAVPCEGVLANMRPKNIKHTDDWDYLCVVVSEEIGSYGYPEYYRLAKVFNGVLSFIGTRETNTYGPGPDISVMGFQSEDGTFIRRKFEKSYVGDDKYNLGVGLLDICGFDILPISSGSGRAIKEYYIAHSGSYNMDMGDTYYYTMFGVPSNMRLSTLCNDYSGTISPSEYNIAERTADNILGNDDISINDGDED